MNVDELRDRTSSLKMRKQSLLNDTFLWVKLAIEAVSELPNTKFEFDVPKAGKPHSTRTVSRADAEKVKNRIINKDIYNSAFITMVASVEDYFSKIITLILKYDIKRIKCTIQGVNMANTISVVDVIDNDKETLIENIVNQRINSLFYASPQKQIEYFDAALGIRIEEDNWEHWIEMKARRDLLVHNAGIINSVYIQKTNRIYNVKLGDEIIIDYEYFSESVANMKKLVGVLDREIRKQYKRE